MPEADDISTEDHTEINLQPLNDDCKLLGSLLDTCLKHEIGETLFAKVGEKSTWLGWWNCQSMLH